MTPTPAIPQEIFVTLVTTALTLQFAAFGWRVIREIQLDDEGRRTWLLVTDIMILLSMCSLAWNCVVLPLSGRSHERLMVVTLSIAYVIIAAHPINTAAHYRFFSRSGRAKYKLPGRDIPYVSDQEWLSLILTFAVVGVTIYLVG